MNAVGYTCQITAGFRAVELSQNPQPIISDHIAQHLAGAGLGQALSDYQHLVAAQGAGRSLRVPARNRIVDDQVMEALQQLQQQGHTKPVQIVNIGCGMDTKPWRLQPPLAVYWFDVDQPAVMQLKQQLLQQAGAATARSKAGSVQQHALKQQQQQPADVQFPLLIDQWQPLPADLAVTSLTECLQSAGFQRGLVTVWVAEALIYYLPLDAACQLLHDMRTLSALGSTLIATCIDSDLQEAHLKLEQDHYFSTANVAWHFCLDDLLGTSRQRVKEASVEQCSATCGAEQAEGCQESSADASVACAGNTSSTLEKTGWRVVQQPRTTAELALQQYGKQTYVALYGGAEYCFTAMPI